MPAKNRELLNERENDIVKYMIERRVGFQSTMFTGGFGKIFLLLVLKMVLVLKNVKNSEERR